MEFAAELQASLQEFTAFGIVEVRGNVGRVAPFKGASRTIAPRFAALGPHCPVELYELETLENPGGLAPFSACLSASAMPAKSSTAPHALL